MLKTYTRREMTDYWKRRLGLGAIGESEDYGGLESVLATDIDVWYANLLLKGDPALLPQRDFSGILGVWLDDTSVMVRFPKEGSRFISLKMAGWDTPLLSTTDPASETARRQRSPYLRATKSSPVAIRIAGGLIVYGVDGKANGGNQVHELVMTAAPADGTFQLDPSLLAEASLPTFGS